MCTHRQLDGGGITADEALSSVPAKLMWSMGNILFTHTPLIKNTNLLIFIKHFLIKCKMRATLKWLGSASS